MNFEFKTFDLAAAAREKCDALIVLFSAVMKAETDSISALTSSALKAGDLVDKPGKFLMTYRPSGMSATHLVIAGVGEGSPKDVRQAVSAATSAVKGKAAKKICLCFVNRV